MLYLTCHMLPELHVCAREGVCMCVTVHVCVRTCVCCCSLKDAVLGKVVQGVNLLQVFQCATQGLHSTLLRAELSPVVTMTKSL